MNKLLELQRAVSVITKDSTNPFFNSKYFDINKIIETLKPTLEKLELVILQPLRVLDGKNVLTTMVVDGEKILASSEILLPEIQDPQKLGSAITYLRRYSLQSLLLLQGEDDDANLASKPVAKKPIEKDDSLPF